MKIEEIRVTPIAIADPPLRNAAGLHAPFALRLVLELIANNGISGIAEVPGDVRTEEALRSIGGRIVGTDPFNLNAMSGTIENHAISEDERGSAPWDRRVTVHVKSAFEVASLDLVGKHLGLRVCDLLGGTVRDRVPFAAYLFYKEHGAGGELGFDIDSKAQGWPATRQLAALDPEGIVRQAKAMVDEFGFESIKLKGGVLKPDVEVDSMLALRDAFGPGVPLRFDPNAIWSLETAVAMGKRLEGVLEYYEDPVRGQESMAALSARVDIPLATNMCTTSFADLPLAIELGSEKIILADHHFWGGIRPCIALGHICKTFSRGLSMHSNSHLGISLAAMVHLASVVPNLTYALDTHYPWQSEEIITSGRFVFENGSIPVPEGPGLGVELDRNRLEELHKRYLETGLTHRDDESEMQKIEPGWKFSSTRW